jgi:hypothetical protein
VARRETRSNVKSIGGCGRWKREVGREGKGKDENAKVSYKRRMSNGCLDESIYCPELPPPKDFITPRVSTKPSRRCIKIGFYMPLAIKRMWVLEWMGSRVAFYRDLTPDLRP